MDGYVGHGRRRQRQPKSWRWWPRSPSCPTNHVKVRELLASWTGLSCTQDMQIQLLQALDHECLLPLPTLARSHNFATSFVDTLLTSWIGEANL